jgi:hypothetical protein
VKSITKAVAVALIQVLIVCSLGAKLLYDRHTYPQAWFKTERYDPNLPIRGRYVSLQIDLDDSRSSDDIQTRFGNEIRTMEQGQGRYTFNVFGTFGRECGSIDLRGGTPVARFDNSPATWNCDNLLFERRKVGTEIRLRLAEPILFFISDTAKDPTHLNSGDELWVRATIPRKGPPRPIALGVKKAGEIKITSLNLN